MPIDFQKVNQITDAVIGSAIKVHKALGPGLLESAYLACPVFELHRLGIDVEVEKKLPIRYENVRLDCGYKLDILAKDLVVVEIKSVRQLAAIHTAQVLTYLKTHRLSSGAADQLQRSASETRHQAPAERQPNQGAHREW